MEFLSGQRCLINSEPARCANTSPALTTTQPWLEGQVMADQKPTAERPSFQLRGLADGTAAAYLIWRISEKVAVVESGCWEWQGATTEKGYGTLHLKNWQWPERILLIHRLVYELCVDQIADGLCVLHRCDNPPCCNPGHLFLGTNLDNIADKMVKGRQARGESVRGNHEHLKGEVVATARLTAEQVMEIRRRDVAGESPREIANDVGLSATQILYVVTGKAWAHLPLLYTGDRDFRPCPKCGRTISTRGGMYYKHVKACIDLLLGKE